MIIKQKIKFNKISDSSPEQYEALYEGHTTAYLRLRSGIFQVCFPDAGGIVIYEKVFKGEYLKGDFSSRKERDKYLRRAKGVIYETLSNCA